ncbi:MAG TPA: glucose-1-phosphate adenylyltransferase [Candidatus Limiplasma sp.]|nr:glucose-1-phosphate adenylyltransferase [Candidatus Limiplasma sp.]HRX08720.1 glucose-1-phosphate adenylyltransferase [Candidatus Limiplasma sp.]
MKKKRCIAMLLAGGQGSRLGILTEDMAKPAIPYGGKYRIIDFPLSNCTNSGIDVVGVMTQYQPLELNSYIGSGSPWDLDLSYGGVYVLPPYVKGKQGEWYSGTANAIYQNVAFIRQFNPDHVLILAGDHIYKMDYNAMLNYHIEKEADATIAVREVPWADTSRFGIMNTTPDNVIYEFEEKPKVAKNNKASMGVYIFRWDKLLHYLEDDAKHPDSSNDFGKNIIPNMMADNQRMMAYDFDGYWKDVGTVYSLWEANMDLLQMPMPIDLYDKNWRIYGRNPGMTPHYIAPGATVTNCLVTEGCEVFGKVSHSVLFSGVTVLEGAVVEDSIVMPNAVIERGAVVRRAIIAENAVIGAGAIVGETGGEICVVGHAATVAKGDTIAPGQQFRNERVDAGRE